MEYQLTWNESKHHTHLKADNNQRIPPGCYFHVVEDTFWRIKQTRPSSLSNYYLKSTLHTVQPS